MLEPRAQRAAHGPRRPRIGSARSPIWALRCGRADQERARSHRALCCLTGVVADLTTRLHARMDWSRTRAFTVPGENKGYIRLNLRGRERDGIVDEADADALLTEIAAGIAGFRDPDGSPSVTRVIRMSESLAGDVPPSPMLPDLIVAWGEAPAVPLTHVSSDRFGTVERVGGGSGRSGNHVDDAWALVVHGRALSRGLARQPRITDIGATACALSTPTLPAWRASLCSSGHRDARATR